VAWRQQRLIHSLIHSLTHSTGLLGGFPGLASYPPHLLTTRTSSPFHTHSLTHSLTLTLFSYTTFFVLLTITILRRRRGTLTHSLTHTLTHCCLSPLDTSSHTSSHDE
jgi:hypothetical protein